MAAYEFGRLLLSALVPVRAVGVSSPFVSFLAVIALVVVAVAAARALARGRATGASALATPLVIGCLLALVGLLLLYSRDWKSIQLWYGGNLLVPSAVIMAAAGTTLLAHRLLVPAAVLCLAYLTFGLAGLNTVTYTNQEPTMQAGIALRTAALDGPVGAWNAGVLGFFSDRGVVNLDGLVNDSVVPNILDNDLAGYLRERGIRYIVDYQVMLTAQQYQLQGGYAEGRLGRCLGPPTVIVQSQITWVNSSLRMWQVKPNCL